jgi:hypothetical protein
MNAHSTLGTLLLLAVTIHAEAAAKGAASGTFKYDDKTYTVVDAVAWNDLPVQLSDGTQIRFVTAVLSDKPFDPAAMAKDGRYDDSDLMAHPSATLSIMINVTDGELDGIRMRDAAGSGADFRCKGPNLLTVTKNDATTIGGRFKCMEHNVTFEAPILKAPKPPAP